MNKEPTSSPDKFTYGFESQFVGFFDGYEVWKTLFLGSHTLTAFLPNANIGSSYSEADFEMCYKSGTAQTLLNSICFTKAYRASLRAYIYSKSIRCPCKC